MKDYSKQDFATYINTLQNSLDMSKDAIRFVIAPIKEEIKEVDKYSKKCIENASKVFLDLFEDEDDAIIYIEATDADLEENYNEVIEDEIENFYSQFIKSKSINSSIKTFSTFLNEDGSEGLTDYTHVDLYDEDGNKQYVELLINHVLEGKVKDFEMIGLITGKCNMMEGFDGDDDMDFIIGDSINIINKSKNIIYKIHNDVYLDVLTTDEKLLSKIKDEYADLIF